METSLAGYTMLIQKKTGSGTDPNMNYSAAKQAALTLRAVNHNTRKKIIKLLQENARLQVSEIHTKLDLQQAVASQHLAILRKVKIVKVQYTDRDCRVIYYSLNLDRLAEIASFSSNMTH